MAFIFGVATQEADLYKIFRDYISGCGRPGKVVRSGTGNGELNNLIYPQGSAALYETITLTCVTAGPRQSPGTQPFLPAGFDVVDRKSAV